MRKAKERNILLIYHSYHADFFWDRDFVRPRILVFFFFFFFTSGVGNGLRSVVQYHMEITWFCKFSHYYSAVDMALYSRYSFSD